MKLICLVPALALWANGVCAYKRLSPQQVADNIKAQE
jgi:hypothetical protein